LAHLQWCPMTHEEGKWTSILSEFPYQLEP
jgi:hypothetical protein